MFVCISFMSLHVHVDLIEPLAARNNKRCCWYVLCIDFTPADSVQFPILQCGHHQKTEDKTT